jgi:hypothetical protein
MARPIKHSNLEGLVIGSSTIIVTDSDLVNHAQCLAECSVCGAISGAKVTSIRNKRNRGGMHCYYCRPQTNQYSPGKRLYNPDKYKRYYTPTESGKLDIPWPPISKEFQKEWYPQ